MASAFAVFTSDPNLLRCQVDLVKERLKAATEPVPKAVGLGYIEADSILLRKRPGESTSLDLGRLTGDVTSEVLFYFAGKPFGGAFVDEDIMPLRFRRWMFLHTGALASPAKVRATLLKTLPDYLAFQIKGTTASEVCFLTFMRLVRERGLTEGFDVNPQLIGKLLGETARRVELAERAEGRVGDLGFMVSNGRVLAAVRLGQAQLHYALLEGISRCQRCGVSEATPDSNPLRRAHRRVRGVVLATQLNSPAGFIEVPEASCITVGQDLNVQVAPVPAIAG